jgi:hypothetical protein
MERPFNYIIQTRSSSLAQPFDNYDRWRAAPRHDDIVTCIEETYRVYGRDPTIKRSLDLAVTRLAQPKYTWRHGTVCAIQIRNKRNEIVEKLIDLFGELLTSSMMNKILSKGNKLQVRILRKLAMANGGSLVTKTTIDRLFSLGVDFLPTINSINAKLKKTKSRQKPFQLEDKHIVSYVLSESQYSLFSKLFSEKHLKIAEKEYDFIEINDHTRELQDSIRKAPVIKRVMKFIQKGQISPDLGYKLYGAIIDKKFKKRQPSIQNIIGVLIVLDVMGCPDMRIYLQIKKKIIKTIQNMADKQTKLDILIIRKDLRCLSRFARKCGIELIDRSTVLEAMDLDNSIDLLRIIVDPTITYYDPISDLPIIECTQMYQTSDEYIEHLIDRGYLKWPTIDADENVDNILLYLYSHGFCDPIRYRKKFSERGVDIFNHPLTDEIMTNLIGYSLDWAETVIRMLVKNKWCFSSNDIDVIRLPETLRYIYESRLSVETEGDLLRLKNIIRRIRCEKKVELDPLNYRDLIIAVIATMSDYQMYHIFKKVNIPKRRKGETVEKYIQRQYSDRKFWKSVFDNIHEYENIHRYGLELTPELAELTLLNARFVTIMAVDPIYVEWFRSLDDEVLMTSPYRLTWEYLLNVKHGDINPYNLDRFIDPDTLKFWRECRIGRLKEEEDNFHISSCSVADMEKIEIIKALPAHYERVEEEAVIESFNLLIEDDSE